MAEFGKELANSDRHAVMCTAKALAVRWNIYKNAESEEDFEHIVQTVVAHYSVISKQDKDGREGNV